MAKLTPRQEAFVEEYLLDLNATQAAIRAGYSPRTAEQQAARLLRNVKVQREIQSAMKNREQRTQITQDKVLDEIGAVAFHKAADCTDSELKYSSKLRALELLGKHMGLFDGRSGKQERQDNNLLEAIQKSAEEELETDDLPEVE